MIGLATAPEYGRINMYRPAFDMLVEWDRRPRVPHVYEAYTPLRRAVARSRGAAATCATCATGSISAAAQGQGPPAGRVALRRAGAGELGGASPRRLPGGAQRADVRVLDLLPTGGSA